MLSKQKLKKLYGKGMSMAEIAEKFGCSVNKVRYWMEKHRIPRRSMSEATYYAYQRRFNKQPFQISKNLTSEEKRLKIAGIMLYWAEGVKGGNAVALSNSDPKLIQIFLKFLRNICGVREERLRALLHYYNDQDNDRLKRYWSRITNIPLSQFTKSYLHKNISGTYKSRSKYGTIRISYCDKRLLMKIQKWTKEYLDKNLNE